MSPSTAIVGGPSGKAAEAIASLPKATFSTGAAVGEAAVGRTVGATTVAGGGAVETQPASKLATIAPFGRR
jgi:hypothetical protein